MSQVQVFQGFVAIARGTAITCLLGFVAISCPKGGIATARIPKAGRNFMFSRFVATPCTQGLESEYTFSRHVCNCNFSLVCRNYMSPRGKSQLHVPKGEIATIHFPRLVTTASFLGFVATTKLPRLESKLHIFKGADRNYEQSVHNATAAGWKAVVWPVACPPLDTQLQAL